MGFNYRILVVDDELSILEMSAMVLQSKGYEVRTATDGFGALVELRRSLPDILISDLSMPNMSGFELLSVVRRRFPHLPVIAISGNYEATSPNGTIADAFFSKNSCLAKSRSSWNSPLLGQTFLNPIGLQCGFQRVTLDISL